jgi:hypothetical protein
VVDRFCFNRANHQDPVTPPHLSGGQAGSGPPPGRTFQQWIDVGEPTGPRPPLFVTGQAIVMTSGPVN